MIPAAAATARAVAGRVSRIKGVRNFSNLGTSGSSVASGFASGGLGKAVDRAARATVGNEISKAAEKAANSYRRREKNRTPAEARIKQKEEAENRKKISGVGFWMVLGVCLVKDVLDIFTNLSVILSIAVWITTMIILFIVNFYLFYNGVKPTTKKVLWQAVVFVGDALPFVSMFIGYTIYLIFVRIVENNEFSGLINQVKGGNIAKLLPTKKAA